MVPASGWQRPNSHYGAGAVVLIAGVLLIPHKKLDIPPRLGKTIRNI